MYNSTLRFRSFFLSALLAVLAAGSSVAQSQMQARNFQSDKTRRTDSPELAVDDLLSTAANVNPALIGGAALRVSFPTAVQPGQQGILLIKSSTSLASVLSGMRLRTYSSSQPDVMLQDIPMSNSSLVQVTVDKNDPSEQQAAFTANQSFDQLELTAGTVLNTSYSVNVYAVFATVAPLPVQLTSFVGKATPAGVALKWETASERNADYFEVQRTEGMSASFRSLGQVKCAGTTAQAHTYQFVDAASSSLHYYRLRQVDVDGQESFSPVVTVAGGALAAVLTAYPTLATSTLTITGAAGTQLGIFNQQGVQVQLADLAASQTQQLDVRSLPGGLYFLRDAATGQSTRFVKSSSER